MAFVNIDELKRGTESLDTRFSPFLEPNLFHKKVFQAGITFNDKHERDGAGQIVVRKLGVTSVDKSNSMKFTHTQTADSLIPIVLDKSYKGSEEIYEAVEIARESKTAGAKMEIVINSISDEWQKDAHYHIAKDATALPNTTKLTATTVKKGIIDGRKESVENKSTPDALIVSTDTYGLLLELEGKEYRPNSNEEILRTGIVGVMYGMNVMESAQLADVKGTGTPAGDPPVATDENIEFLMYNHEAYSILTQVIAIRVVDAGKDWVGSVAQAHIISGFKVTNKERVFKKIYA